MRPAAGSSALWFKKARFGELFYMIEQSKMFALGLIEFSASPFVCTQNIGQDFYQRMVNLSECARCPYNA